MEEALIQAVKSVPSLAVLCFLVYVFVKYGIGYLERRDKSAHERYLEMAKTFTSTCVAAQGRLCEGQDNLTAAVTALTPVMSEVKGVLLKINGGP
jgi:hypothetical protein